ncbi:hypothetical protein D3871_28000 [Noviherbaspirillum saxi]|uniref:Uncharacterized protein n=1 Tax=Noviherbaspirillum saxi TaxID=2320863 RepID=A0A3A3FZE8_9BURK|nr:hypothetical protein D3871_28000 [Noviherbaspirillum saxi]
MKELPAPNRTRQYRLMSQNGLLLVHQPQKQPDRPHERVSTLKSNFVGRGCFDIPCRNRTVVRATCLIDTYDRETIAPRATAGGFDGETVRDLMLLCAERRFGCSLELVPCFKPVRSPESNGL